MFRPARMTGTFRAAPTIRPAAAGIIGSPTAAIASMASFFICSMVDLDLDMPSLAMLDLRE